MSCAALMADGPAPIRRAGRGSSAACWGPWIEHVRVPPSGTWEKRRAHLFQTAENWLGPEDVEEDGRARPPRSPVSRRLRPRIAKGHRAVVPPDARRPRAGARAARRSGAFATRAAASSSTSRARRFRIPTRLRRCASSRPGTPCSSCTRGAPACSRSSYRPLVFHTKNPPSVPTFLVDGSVAGTWRYDDGHVRWDAFERLDRAVAREVDDEAERLAAFHA